MDNSSIPSFQIPKSPEADPSVSRTPENDQVRPESANSETLPVPVQAMPSATPLQPSGNGQVAVMQQPSSVPADDAHLIADDVDVIEKEWVDRAKKLIAATSHDPYLESQELSKLKATYMKKRFDKTLPLAGDAK